jgi:integration host factor subunit alpha
LSAGPAKLTRAALYDAVRQRIQCSRAEAKRIVDDVFVEIEGSILAGESVKLTGFGTFEVQAREARPGRNPATGETHLVSARQVVHFRPSQRLREAINPDRD